MVQMGHVHTRGWKREAQRRDRWGKKSLICFPWSKYCRLPTAKPLRCISNQANIYLSTGKHSILIFIVSEDDHLLPLFFLPLSLSLNLKPHLWPHFLSSSWFCEKLWAGFQYNNWPQSEQSRMKRLMKQLPQRELTEEDIQSHRCLSYCVCFILIPL